MSVLASVYPSVYGPLHPSITGQVRYGVALNPIAALFADGQDGLWLDTLPKYLYEDSAGTIEDVVNGDPVGLGLDRHKGLALGPEQSPDPEFDDSGVWTTASTITITGGQLVAVGASGSADNAQTNSLVPFTLGRRYEVTVDLESIAGGAGSGFFVRLSFGSTVEVIPRGSPKGVYTAIINAGQDGSQIYLNPRADITVNSVTVKELPGNHLTQATSADRPTYNTDGTLHWITGDGVSDDLEVPWFQQADQDQLLVFGFEQVEARSFRYVFGAADTEGVGLIVNTGVLRPYVKTASGTQVVNGSTIANGTPVVVSVEWVRSTGNLRVYLDGTLDAQVTTTAENLVTGTLHTLFNNGPSGAQFFDGKIHGAIGVSGDLSGRVDAENYIAGLQGRTL